MVSLCLNLHLCLDMQAETEDYVDCAGDSHLLFIPTF